MPIAKLPVTDCQRPGGGHRICRLGVGGRARSRPLGRPGRTRLVGVPGEPPGRAGRLRVRTPVPSRAACRLAGPGSLGVAVESGTSRRSSLSLPVSHGRGRSTRSRAAESIRSSGDSARRAGRGRGAAPPALPAPRRAASVMSPIPGPPGRPGRRQSRLVEVGSRYWPTRTEWGSRARPTPSGAVDPMILARSNRSGPGSRAVVTSH